MHEVIDLAAAGDSQIRTLIERAASGERAASAALVAGIAPALRARVTRTLARRRGQSAGRVLRPDVEDLIQEVFAALFADRCRALRAWDPARGLGFLGFVGLVAEREVGMRMRSRRQNPWTEEPTADDSLQHLGGTADGLALQIESRDLLRRIVDRLRERLTPQGSRYFLWFFVEARSVRAVGEETGVSAEALYAWRSRLARAVREILAELAAGSSSNSNSNSNSNSISNSISIEIETYGVRECARAA